MANVNNPYGLKPMGRTISGGFPQCNKYSKLATYAQPIYKWDPVTLLNTGYLGAASADITPGTTQYLGVALNWSPLSTASDHQVMDDPSAVFEAQEDASGAANVVIAKMGFLANLALGTAGGGVTRDNSGAQISGTSINTTNTLDVRVERLVDDITNAYGANARLEIRFNKHLKNPGVTGV